MKWICRTWSEQYNPFLFPYSAKFRYIAFWACLDVERTSFSYFISFAIVILNRLLCSPYWLWICFVDRDGLELVIFLTLRLQFWDNQCASLNIGSCSSGDSTHNSMYAKQVFFQLDYTSSLRWLHFFNGLLEWRVQLFSVRWRSFCCVRLSVGPLKSLHIHSIEKNNEKASHTSPTENKFLLILLQCKGRNVILSLLTKFC